MLAAVLALAAALASPAAPPAAEQSIAWRDYPAAGAEARRTGRPMLVYVGTTWCGACKALDSGTWANDTVASFVKENLVPAKVVANVGDDAAVAEKLRVNAYPTVTLVSPEGIELRRFVGFIAPDAFVERARAIMAEPIQVAALAWAVQQAPDDLMARGRLGLRQLEEGLEADALVNLRLVVEKDGANESTVLDDALVALASREPASGTRAMLLERARSSKPDAATLARIVELERSGRSAGRPSRVAEGQGR